MKRTLERGLTMAALTLFFTSSGTVKAGPIRELMNTLGRVAGFDSAPSRNARRPPQGNLRYPVFKSFQTSQEKMDFIRQNLSGVASEVREVYREMNERDIPDDPAHLCTTLSRG